MGFSQQKMIDNNLSLGDLVVLREIVDMYNSGGMESITDNGKRYIWLKQEYLHEQLPGVGSIRTIKRILGSLCGNGFLEKNLVTSRKGTHGKFYYVRPTGKVEDLENNEGNSLSIKGQNGTRYSVKMALDHGSKWPIKDSSIISYSSNRDNILSGKPDSALISRIVDYLNDKAGTSYRATTKKTADLINARLKEGFTLEDFQTVIDKKCQEWKGKTDDKGNNWESYLRPNTLFGDNFDSYLNQKSAEKESKKKPSGPTREQLEAYYKEKLYGKDN